MSFKNEKYANSTEVSKKMGPKIRRHGPKSILENFENCKKLQKWTKMLPIVFN